jgi:hypothetical protein
MRRLPARSTLQSAAAIVAIVFAIVLAFTSLWPFDTTPPPPPSDPTLWQLMFSDHVTLGFVRLGLALLALFVVASVPALIVGGRWIKAFGTGGLTADDAASANVELENAKKKLDDLALELDAAREERDRAIEMARRALGRRPSDGAIDIT